LELDNFLKDLGFIVRQSGKGSSHYVYSHPEINMLVVLVSHGKNDTLPEYQVKKAINAIKLLENRNEKN
jgi:predicted RNA binding protein YcfA (HicA-like mRNA interferase family)